MTDQQPPVLVELFKLLPPPGQAFDPFDRQRWIAAASAVLDVVYARHATTPAAAEPPRRGRPRRRAAVVEASAVPAPTTETGNAPAATASPQPSVLCPNCSREFRNQHALQVHQARSRCNQPAKLTVAPAPEPEPAPEPPADVETPPPSHSCADCPQTFGSVLELDSHRRRFHGVRMAPLDSRPTIDTDAARRRAAEAI